MEAELKKIDENRYLGNTKSDRAKKDEPEEEQSETEKKNQKS